MTTVIRRLAGPVIVSLSGMGLTMSGFENIWIAIGCWIVAFIWLVVALITWTSFKQIFHKTDTTPELVPAELKRECLQLSQDLLQFLVDRKKVAPNMIPSKARWRKQTNESLRYNDETVALYHQRFGSRVVWVYEALKERGYSDNRIDRFYEHPTNELGVRELAQSLGALAKRLP